MRDSQVLTVCLECDGGPLTDGFRAGIDSQGEQLSFIRQIPPRALTSIMILFNRQSTEYIDQSQPNRISMVVYPMLIVVRADSPQVIIMPGRITSRSD